MTPEELQAIEERANAATPGPWVNQEMEIIIEKAAWPWNLIADVFLNNADAAFIADARADIPALVAEVRRLQDDAQRLEHYRQFVAQISEALGVPDDSMILPHAQKMATEITRLRAELAAVPVDAIRRNMYDQADAAEYRQIRDWLGI